MEGAEARTFEGGSEAEGKAGSEKHEGGRAVGLGLDCTWGVKPGAMQGWLVVGREQGFWTAAESVSLDLCPDILA